LKGLTVARLVKPSIEYKNSFIAAIREFRAEKSTFFAELDIAVVEENFESYVNDLLSREKTPSKPGWVPSTTFWLIDDDIFIGYANVRHALNENLRKFGGHIGYAIRSSQRRQGHGTEMLRMTLMESRAMGLKKVLITCDETNSGSRKIIEANGGVLEDVIQLDFRDAPTMRWWIEL
jgi:predicted acetyltransferase